MAATPSYLVSTYTRQTPTGPQQVVRREWTHKEIAWLIDNYARRGLKACAEILGRTEGSVLHQAKNYHTQSPRCKHGRAFTADEISYILANYAEDGPTSVATELGRNPRSIKNKAHRLGLHYQPRSAFPEAKQMRRLGYCYRHIGERFGYSASWAHIHCYDGRISLQCPACKGTARTDRE